MMHTSKNSSLSLPGKPTKVDAQVDLQLFFDQVTDLYNHSAFHFYLGQEIKRAVRYQKEFVVALIGKESLGDTLNVIRHHHEKIDGSGYPDKLDGENIPLMARIIAIVDMFDALCSDRPYRKGLSLKVAMNILKKDVENKKTDKEIFSVLNEIIV